AADRESRRGGLRLAGRKVRPRQGARGAGRAGRGDGGRLGRARRARSRRSAVRGGKPRPLGEGASGGGLARDAPALRIAFSPYREQAGGAWEVAAGIDALGDGRALGGREGDGKIRELTRPPDPYPQFHPPCGEPVVRPPPKRENIRAVQK